MSDWFETLWSVVLRCLGRRPQRPDHEQGTAGRAETAPQDEAPLSDEDEAALLKAIQAISSTEEESIDGLDKDRARKLGHSAIPVIERALRHKDWEIRAQAAMFLRKLGTGATRPLVKALGDESKYVRLAAVRSLKPMAREAEDVLPDLERALQDKCPEVRVSVVACLGEMGPEAIDALVSAMHDEDANVRAHVAKALANIGPHAIPALENALKDEHVDIRSKAAEALGKIGPDAKPTVPALVQALHDKEFMVRAWAAEALGQIGPAAKTAVPDLKKARRDRSLVVRAWAAEALLRIQESS